MTACPHLIMMDYARRRDPELTGWGFAERFVRGRAEQRNLVVEVEKLSRFGAELAQIDRFAQDEAIEGYRRAFLGKSASQIDTYVHELAAELERVTDRRIEAFNGRTCHLRDNQGKA